MMQSHHHPSPARLGLTASSPSLPPNPSAAAVVNPTSSPPLQGNPSGSAAAGGASAAAAPTLTTSPSLLPLLPPLPRAQSLLQLISALASNLFELSPNRAAWISAYRGSLPTFLPSSAAPPPLPAPISSTKEAMALLNTLQTQLFEAVAELQETLDLQDARARLARDARAKDASILAFAKKLREAHHVLDRLVDDYSDYRRDPKRPRGAAVPEPVSDGDFGASLHSKLDLDDVLTYAHRISYTTFAPPEHGAGLPLRGALPPAPQENEMRMSQLYQFADLDVGVPKSQEAKEGLTAEGEITPLFEPTPPRVELPPPRPSMLPNTVRMELPPNIPLPPPGWKPGDPITLLPDSIMAGLKGEEPRASLPHMPAIVPAMVPKAQEPIQVQHVALDIDIDNTSSDEYSSDVATSEEDDED
uniref:Mediator of RNA polymerase II transcription subunit 4 n=1 Tax=Leersia perrieri TaxID=77586 RepID=A0A0D9XG55_9ORYZ